MIAQKKLMTTVSDWQRLLPRDTNSSVDLGPPVFPSAIWSGDPKKSQGINTEGVPQIRKKSTASSNKRWYRVIQNMLIIALDGFFHPYNHRGVDRYPPSTGARNGSTSAPRGTQRTQRCRGRSFQSLWRFQQHPWGKTMAWRFQQHFE